MDFFINIFSSLINWLNSYVGDYGWALVLLGVITKLMILRNCPLLLRKKLSYFYLVCLILGILCIRYMN